MRSQKSFITTKEIAFEKSVQTKSSKNQILEKIEKNEKSKSVQKQVKKKTNRRLEKRLGEGSSSTHASPASVGGKKRNPIVKP